MRWAETTSWHLMLPVIFCGQTFLPSLLFLLGLLIYGVWELFHLKRAGRTTALLLPMAPYITFALWSGYWFQHRPGYMELGYKSAIASADQTVGLYAGAHTLSCIVVLVITLLPGTSGRERRALVPLLLLEAIFGFASVFAISFAVTGS